MKKPTICLFILTLSCMLLLSARAQEQKAQLWLAGVEVVKSDMITQYMDFNKEMIALCKTEKFPYSFYVWTSGDFQYYIWYPIESYNDLPEIEKAWKAIIDKWGAEKYAKFQECLEYSEEKVMISRPDLYLEPKDPAAVGGESMYCWWEEFYIKKGHEKAVEALVQQAVKLLGNRNFQTFMGDGKVGFENPVLILWSFGKDKNDYWIKDKANWEQVDEQTLTEFGKITDEFSTHLRKIVTKDYYYLKDISYEKAE